MNTFLPYPDFEKSAVCLDDARLRKQCVETYQILLTNLGKSNAWKNHPAVLQWRNYDICLAYYGVHISAECVQRGFNGNNYFDQFLTGVVEVPTPDWFGKPQFHASHRSRLKFKGRVDAACYSLRSFLKVRSINEWFKSNGWPQKNVFKHADIIKLEAYCLDLGVKIQDNWYDKFGWQESDELPYWWPTKNL